jgi:hypothetical protein
MSKTTKTRKPTEATKKKLTGGRRYRVEQRDDAHYVVDGSGADTKGPFKNRQRAEQVRDKFERTHGNGDKQ